MLDNVSYKNKTDASKNVAKINNRIIGCPVDISVGELAQAIKEGKSFVPGYLKPNTKRNIKNWVSQQVICLDIDNDEWYEENGKRKKRKKIHMTLEQAIEEFKDSAVFIYTTFSHTKSWPKFRVVFVLDREIDDYNIYQKVMDYFLKKYPFVDQSCKDGSRIFFGGKEVIELDFTNRVSVDEVLKQKYYKKGFRLDKGYDNPLFLSNQKPLKQQSMNIKYIIDKNIDKLHEILKPNKVKLNNLAEVYDYLKKQDLREYLGVFVSNPFNDIFHQDKNPSATIFKSQIGNGHYLYKCHSNSSPFVGTIIEVTQKLTNMNHWETVKFLMRVYKIEIVESEQQKTKKEVIDLNKYLLCDPNLHEIYPYFEKLIRNYKNDLYILLDLAKDYVYHNNSKIIFYKPIREIAKQLNVSKSTVAFRINFFVLFNLLNKLEEKDVPKKWLEEAKKIKDQKNMQYMYSFYEIPSYDYNLMSEVNKKAKIWLEKGGNMKMVNYEGVMRIFGREEADRVFVQDKGREISEFRQELTKKLEEAALKLIDEKGWVLENEIVDNLKLGIKGETGIKKNQLKRILGEMLDKYDLKRVRLNKELKLNLGVNCAGYPNVIMRTGSGNNSDRGN